ncbi:helix-turn-helix domain-containing protein [Vagococcus fluvialis]|uniref:helix-turn-helix domain-containing protein n=1 Tax=Vagococcus fluvialis TaxID=2738 RepID=UPI001A8EADE3|nr:helix-turn-helix transcriptional regulator [Vagococcus fluvialis]MBO0488519.1 helix-turn-helix transcriptional regulator [Vagococcus fluvialis]
MAISEMLKEKRQENQLTQEQLSEKIFVSRKTISNWETGKTTPDIDSLIRLANLFDLSLDNLLLEGSIIVKDIKKKADLRIIKTMCFITFSTNIIFLFSIFTQNTFGYIAQPVLIAIMCGALANFFSLFYFIIKLSKYDDKSYSKLDALFSLLIFLLVLGLLVYINSK